MIPSYYQRLAEQIHQERIRDAMRPRPEWSEMSLRTRPGRPSLRAWLLARLRPALSPGVGSRPRTSAKVSRSSGLTSNF
jgi:hypothetical protein